MSIVDAQVLRRADIEPEPQILAARRMEEKDSIDCRCSAYLLTRRLPTSLTFSVLLDARTPISDICSDGERWAPEAYAWDVVRTRADFCPRRNHDRYSVPSGSLNHFCFAHPSSPKIKMIRISSATQPDVPTILRRPIESLR
jgi:hypothetical protein